MSLRALINQKH